MRAHTDVRNGPATRNSEANRKVPMRQLASVIRSKLAGPYRVTFDVIFPDEATYRLVVDANVLTRERIAEMYNVPPTRISSLFHVPMANAIKFTMTRTLDPVFSTSDSHGAQQHAPLLDVLVPIANHK